MSDTYIINLGGSLIVPDDIDTAFLKRFKMLLEKEIASGKRFVLITGGGKTARKYQGAIGEVDASLTDEDRDWLGIHATRLNAHLIRTIFRDKAYPRINTNPHEWEDFSQAKEPIIVAAGWRPGFSTDYDTALIAVSTGAKAIVNLSNITHVYDADPKEHPNAQPVNVMSWSTYRAMVGDEWKPGMNAPFDPVAAKLADEHNLEVVTIGGQNLDELRKYLHDEDFEGSRIVNE
jgi:uridylate kinase